MRHRYVQLFDTRYDLQNLDSHTLMILHAESANNLRCSYCQQIVRLVGIDRQWSFEHVASPDHQAERASYQRSRYQMRERLQELFPDATVADAVLVDTAYADVALLTLAGGKMSVKMQMDPWQYPDLETYIRVMNKNGVVTLFLQHLDLLTSKAIKKSPHHRVKLDAAQTALLAHNRPLWFYDHRHGAIVNVTVHPEVMPLAKHMKQLGLVECAIRAYPLSQFHLQSGLVAVLKAFEPATRPWGDLPARFAKKRLELGI